MMKKPCFTAKSGPKCFSSLVHATIMVQVKKVGIHFVVLLRVFQSSKIEAGIVLGEEESECVKLEFSYSC